MKNYLPFLSILILLIFGLNNLYARSENFIIAKIGKKIITNFDVKNKIIGSLLISGEEINQKTIDNLKSQSLDNLIILKLKEIELEKFDYIIEKNRINSYLAQLSNNNLEELKKKFSNFNIDFEYLKKEIETELKWQKYIFQRYSKKIQINEKTIDNEVKKVLASNISDDTEVNLSEILVYQNENIPNEEIIAKIKQEIRENGFEKTALKFSISNLSSEKGGLGWLNLNSLSEKIRNIVQAMSINEISEPIIEPNSILFLKMNAKRSVNKNIDKTRLKNSIIQRKQNEMFHLYSKSHLSKLKNKTLIEFK